MKLTMTCNDERQDVDFLRDRLYVIRTLVPPGFEAYFRQKARYINAHTSTAIEGNQIGEQQALLVLVEGADESEPEEIEITNLQAAYELVDQLVGDQSVKIDQGLIRTMNSLILKGLPGQQAQRRGRYRVGPALIVDSQTRDIRYRPPPPAFVPELMEAFVADIQQWMAEGTYPSPIVAAMAHFGLISIHPFEDGNGRTARLLADTILTLTDWSADGLLSVSQSIWDQRQKYYDTLRDTQGENFSEAVDTSPFVEFHQTMLSMASAQLERAVVRFNREKDSFVEHLEGTFNARQALGTMFMLDLSPLSTSAYARLTNASQSVAFSDLKDMVEAGIVMRKGRGKNTRYTIDDEFRKVIGAGLEEKELSATT